MLNLKKLLKKQQFQQEEVKQEEEVKKAFVVDTNIPLHCVRFGLGASLNKLQGAYIPWAVIRELMTSARLAESDGPELKDLERRFAWRKALIAQGWDKDKILAREARCPYAQEACSIVQAKINQGSWKTVGTWTETNTWVEGFLKDIEREFSRADLEVLASCFLLVEAGHEVVLITRDRRLREVAEKQFKKLKIKIEIRDSI